jgi:hypothetical protein
MTRYAPGYTGPMSPGGRPRPTPKPRDIGTGMGPRPTITPRPRDIGTGNVPPPGIGPIKQALNKPAMKKGGKVKKMAMGGSSGPLPQALNKPTSMIPQPKVPVRRGSGPNDAGPMGPRGPKNPGPMPLPRRGSGPNDAGPGRLPVANPVSRHPSDFGLKKGGGVKKMAGGGLAAGHKAADGIARKGKTKAMQVKMAGGGKTKKYC